MHPPDAHLNPCLYCKGTKCDTCEGHMPYRGFRAFRDYLLNPSAGSTKNWALSWDQTKVLVLLRNRKCQACKYTRSIDMLQVVPPERGGTYHPANLIALCGPCRNARTRKHSPLPITKANATRTTHDGFFNAYSGTTNH